MTDAAHDVVARREGDAEPAVPPRPGRRPGAGDREGRAARRWRAAAGVAVAWAAVAAVAGPEGGVLNPEGWPMAARFLAAALEPELSGSFLRVTATAALTTAAYAVVSATLSIAVGLLGGVALSETWWRTGWSGERRARPRAGWSVARLAAAAPRGLHEGVWGVLLVLVLGLDPITAVLALALPYGAVTAKVVADLVDEHRGPPYEALRAVGAGRLAALAYGLAPSVRADIVSYGFHRLECAVRGAVVLGLVGAGGLGFQLALSLRSLRYGEVWTLIGAVVVLAAAADAWSARVRRHPGRRSAAWSLAVGALLVALGWWHLALDPRALWAPRTFRLLGELVTEALPPRLPDGGLARLGALALETLQVSLLGTALAAVAGTALAFAAVGGRSGTGVVARAALLLARAVPPPLWALLWLFLLRPGPLPGALALGAYTTGVLGRLVAEVVEHLDPAPADALRAGGAAPLAAFAYATLPQVLPRALAHTLERWEVSLRETVVVGIVGAGGLGRLLAEQLSAFAYAEASTTLAALVVLTALVDQVSSAARRALR